MGCANSPVSIPLSRANQVATGSSANPTSSSSWEDLEAAREHKPKISFEITSSNIYQPETSCEKNNRKEVNLLKLSTVT